MGACVSRGEICIEQQQNSSVEYDDYNDSDIDINSFKMGSYLGVGGSGVVKTATKITGKNCGRVYALKSLSKSYLLRKQSGPDSAFNELKVLVAIAERSNDLSTNKHNFIANIHYAFQDDSHLYFALDYASNGDMRNNLGRYCLNFINFYSDNVFYISF